MPLAAHRARIWTAIAVGGLALITWGPGPVGAALGALVFLVAASRSTHAGLAGVVAGLPFYLFARPVAGFAISPPEAALLLTTLAVGVRTVLAWRFREARTARAAATAPAFQPTAYDRPIALFLAAALLSLLVTEYLRLSLRELRTLIVEPVLFFYLVRATVRSSEEALKLVDALAAATTAVAILGIVQLVLGGAVTDVQGVRRVHGTYTSPNHLGLLLGRVIPLLLAAVWLIPGRAVRASAGVLCLIALGLTFSIGGWLGTGAAVLVVVGLLGGRRGLTVGTLAGLALGLGALALLRVERVLSRLDLSQGTTLVRLQLWEASVQMLSEQPILGIGLDNFLYRYTAYIPPALLAEPNLSHPHNLVLQFWLQLGFAGLVALAWLLVVFVSRTLRHTRGSRPTVERMLAVGALASMADFVVHGLIDNSYFLVDMAFIFWLTLAIGDRPSAGVGTTRGVASVSERPGAPDSAAPVRSPSEASIGTSSGSASRSDG